MNHRMKSGALTLSLIALAACSDTAGLESSFEASLTLDVAMISADATIGARNEFLMYLFDFIVASSGRNWTKLRPLIAALRRNTSRSARYPRRRRGRINAVASKITNEPGAGMLYRTMGRSHESAMAMKC